MAKRKSRSQKPAAAPAEAARDILLHTPDLGVQQILQLVVQQIDAPGRVLSELAAYDPDSRIAERAGLLLFTGLRETPPPESVKRELRSGAKAVLAGALPDKSIPDDRKMLLTAIFGLAGGHFSAEEYGGFFKDFDAAARKMVGQVEARLSDEASQLEDALSGMEIIELEQGGPREKDIEYVARTGSAFAAKNPAGSAALTCGAAAIAIEAGIDPQRVVPYLEPFAEQRSDRAAWYLSELARWPAGGEIADKADIIAQRMVTAGATPHCRIDREYSHGFVSMVDGSGSRNLTLFFRTPEGGMDALVLIINDSIGLKDAWMTFDDSAALEEAIYERENDIVYAQISLAFARDVLADAWALHERLDRPLLGRFFIYRNYLGDEPILPRQREPNLGAYMMEMMVPTPALTRKSDELLDYGPYGGLAFSSDPAYAFVRDHLPKRGSRLKKADFEAFLREVEVYERDWLLARMAANLELEALAGRATQDVNQTAARTYVALKQGVVPFHEVPFIRAIAQEAAERIIGNLKAGYASQQEANEAGLAMDDEMSRMIQNLQGGWLGDLEDDEDEDDNR